MRLQSNRPTPAVFTRAHSRWAVVARAWCTSATPLSYLSVLLTNLCGCSSWNRWTPPDALAATDYVYATYANQTTGMSKMDPGLDVHHHPIHPNITGEPNTGLTDYIVKEKLFNFFLNDGLSLCHCIRHFSKPILKVTGTSLFDSV